MPAIHRVLLLFACTLLVARPATAEEAKTANRSKFNKVLAPGDPAPVFEDLPGADGEKHSLKDHAEAKAVVVVFASTLCAVVDIYEERVAALARDYAEKGVVVVAISCERRGIDADGIAGDIVSPEDSGELARIRKRVSTSKLPFDYLYDGSQSLGRKYGVNCTPTVFVLDGERRIAYLGAFDDSFPIDGVMEHYTRDAVDAVLAGRTPETRESLARGCRLDFTGVGE